MKKILFLLLFIPSISFGQSWLRLPYWYLLHTYQGDTIKQQFSGDSAKWHTNKSYFSLDKPLVIQGHVVGSSGTESDPIFGASVAKHIKASDTARWASGGGSIANHLKNYHLDANDTAIVIKSASTSPAISVDNLTSGAKGIELTDEGGGVELKINHKSLSGMPIQATDGTNNIFTVDLYGNVNIPTGSTYQINGVPISSVDTTYTGTWNNKVLTPYQASINYLKTTGYLTSTLNLAFLNGGKLNVSQNGGLLTYTNGMGGYSVFSATKGNAEMSASSYDGTTEIVTNVDSTGYHYKNGTTQKYNINTQGTAFTQGDSVVTAIKLRNGTYGHFAGSGSSVDTITKVGTATNTLNLTNKTLNSITNYIDANAQHFKVYNNSGGVLAIGTPVYQTQWNATNNCAEVGKAIATSLNTTAIGFTETAIADGSVGEARVSGDLGGLNTNSFSENQIIYLSQSTAGGYTNVMPTTGIIQKLGKVTKQNATTGVISILIGTSQQQATTSQGGYVSGADFTMLSNKQSTLISGTNIKTINGNTILGSGNLSISSGPSYSVITMPTDKKLFFTNISTRVKPYILTGNTTIIADTTGSFSGATNYLEISCPNYEYQMNFSSDFIPYNGDADTLTPISGRKYYYQITRAWSDLIYYKKEFYRQVWTALTTPTVTATPLDTGSLRFKCNQISNNAGYKWLISNDGVSFSDYTTTATNVDSITITGLNHLTTRYVKVKAIGDYSSYSDGYYSSAASTTTSNIVTQWINILNMQVNSNGDASNSSATLNWNCGASSSDNLGTSQNGYVTCTVSGLTLVALQGFIGFGKTNTPPVSSAAYNIPYGIGTLPHNSVYKVWEGGSIVYTSTIAPTNGDVLKIARENGNQIKYYVNNTLMYTSSNNYTGNLYAWVGIPQTGIVTFLNCLLTHL